ncbi:hypothetical protein BJY16_002434 [Actinoplanes octamycinicus]|uniref:SurA-like protein n=1 Tax=Actinoplanes octamycinicus TaxID=135948 RepID=A0A7W7M6P9_9ACTN|nr:hypothetical protein [Actinoplanes octamycinicus]MBB4738975.1 hypothetical protein [Actinoplanes octamycinicus]GIE60104.1 hypothetical protein Aoc01nite_55060 [Actinoplanes octamycinicus]
MAVVASLAIAGLSACRSAPAVAAYVGDSQIPESRVQDIWDDARQAFDAEAVGKRAEAQKAVDAAKQQLAAGQATEVDVKTAEDALAQVGKQMPIQRADVVSVLVSRKLYDQLAQRHSVTLPAELAYDRAGAAVGLPATTEYVRLYTQNAVLQYLVSQSLTGAPALTEADLKEVFRRAEEKDAIQPGTTFEKFRSGLNAQFTEELKSGVALRNELTSVAGPLHITINPRYQPMEIVTYSYPLQNGTGLDLVGARLDEQSGLPVKDVS